MSDALVIIPTYNEKENIAAIIDAVLSLPKAFHVLIIDDGSPDGTAAIVREKQIHYKGQIFLEERSQKSGLGTAYILGFEWAIEKGYHYVLQMDADFSHNPKDLQRLYSACFHNEVDLSIGSRYVRHGKIKNWPLDRMLLSYLASLYVRLITWIPVKDTTAGFVCYRRKTLESINLEKIKFVGYAFQIEMKFAAWKSGFNIVEVPITFADRELGESKMSMHIFKEALLGVLQMRTGYRKAAYLK